jgi:hypothetical protein
MEMFKYILQMFFFRSYQLHRIITLDSEWKIPHTTSVTIVGSIFFNIVTLCLNIFKNIEYKYLVLVLVVLAVCEPFIYKQIIGEWDSKKVILFENKFKKYRYAQMLGVFGYYFCTVFLLCFTIHQRLK